MKNKIVQVNVRGAAVDEQWYLGETVHGKKITEFSENFCSTGQMVSISGYSGNTLVFTIPITAIVMWFYEEGE